MTQKYNDSGLVALNRSQLTMQALRREFADVRMESQQMRELQMVKETLREKLADLELRGEEVAVLDRGFNNIFEVAESAGVPGL
jgi:hypothetical protein